MRKSSALSGLKSAGRDLTTLEINTIVKDNMTGRKMPLPGHAILDILGTYADKLQSYSDRLKYDLKYLPTEHSNNSNETNQELPNDGTQDLRNFDQSLLKCDDEAFQMLRQTAKQFLKDNGASLSEGDQVIVRRIIRNSDQLGGLLRKLETRAPANSKNNKCSNSYLGCNRTALIKKENKLGQHPEPILQPDEVSLVRKVWEIGVEQIVMQSTITITGDVVNRVQSGLTKDRDKDEVAFLLEFHREGVSAGTRMWKLIAETLTSMAGKFVKLLN